MWSSDSLRSLKEPQVFFMLLTLTGIAAWIALDPFKYSMLTDWNSYVSIGLKYSRGNFRDAVNGFWSPFISWVLGIIFFLKISIPEAAKIVFTLFALIHISALYYLLTQLEFNMPEKILLSAASSAGTIYFAAIYATPDILSSAFILFYAASLIKLYKNPALISGIQAGVAGAAGYYFKYYNFPFFIIHFSFFILTAFFILKDRKVINSSLAAFPAFIILTLPWIIILSLKYDGITFSTTGFYNTARLSPEWEHLNKNIEGGTGLLPPPNSTAFGAWEDSYYYPVKRWTPWQSWENFKYNLKNVYQNLYVIKYSIRYASIFAFLILAFAIWEIFRRENSIRKVFSILLLSILILYSSGYALMVADERYFTAYYFLLLITGWLILKRYNIPWRYAAQSVNVLKILMIASFLIMPFRHYFLYKDSVQKSELHHKAALRLAGYIPENSGFSADVFDIALFYAMYSDTRFYGMPAPDMDPEKIILEFKKYGIKYFLKAKNERPSFIKNDRIIFEDKETGIQVFHLEK